MTRLSLVSMAALVAIACGPGSGESRGPVTGHDPSERIAAPMDISLSPASGVTAMEAACVEDDSERCNAIDDNCDGQVDEGCAYAVEGGAPTGHSSLAITVAWNTDADLDLRVTLPTGEVVDRSSGSSGDMHLSHDGAGACRPGDDPRTARAIQRTQLPQGTSRVSLRYADGCGDQRGPTTATVSIEHAGQVRGILNVTLPAPGAEAEVVAFEPASW